MFKRSFQRSTSLLELSCVIFHLKPYLRNVAIVVFINDPSYLSIILVEEVFHLVGVINYIICFRSGRISPQFWEVFHKPTTSLCFRCWFSNNSVIAFLEGSFPSSFVAEDGIFFSILLFQWSIFYSFFRRHCDVAPFTLASRIVRIMSFLCLSI